MRPGRAWVRLQSGKRLDLLDPDMAVWEDRDLAIGLSRTYRWGGQSRRDLPLSVAQHSLLVLVLRQQMQPHAPLDRDDALRELLHDAHATPTCPHHCIDQNVVEALSGLEWQLVTRPSSAKMWPRLSPGLRRASIRRRRDRITRMFLTLLSELLRRFDRARLAVPAPAE